MSVNISSDIKTLVEKKGLSLLWLAEKIGMSKQGFYGMLATNNMKVETLEKIAFTLEVPIIYFFSSEDEKTKILDGRDDDFWSILIKGLMPFGGVFMAYLSMAEIHKIIEKINEDETYTREEIETDLKKFENDIKNVYSAITR